MMDMGSLCTGIGFLDLGLERAGFGPVAWQVEKDEFCKSVLAKHWPETDRSQSDITTAKSLRPVGLVCGGFPCQPASVAGKRRAQSDHRAPRLDGRHHAALPGAASDLTPGAEARLWC